MQEVMLVCFAGLAVMAAAWFVMCLRLFEALKKRFPEKYKEMGSPKLFRDNDMSETIKLIKFLFKKEWRGLGDSEVSNLGAFMLWFFVAYIVLLLIMFSLVLWESRHALGFV
ncbi:hypothetical protein QWY79_01750 [Halomonas sabkhae]|uniref:hypothetical protein n=1 Tax=Halomonas sabkhae TaxID=626223 RepID=UPI0025B587A9|nr:hypothetical protein [Halomonas sabkhae]MDN3523987.1 hypothetical protein [Halomonas sabkhae]